MARHYDQNQGSLESLRDAKMPVVKDMRCPDSCYYGKGADLGEKSYLGRQNKIASSDAAKLKKVKEKM